LAIYDFQVSIDDGRPTIKDCGNDMTSDEMKARTKRFALETLRLVGTLPRTAVGLAIARRLARSGPSVGANYRSACRARSRAEFVARLGVVEEEADESAYWMELIMDGGFLPRDAVASLHNEAEQIVAIVVSSRKTARANE